MRLCTELVDVGRASWRHAALMVDNLLNWYMQTTRTLYRWISVWNCRWIFIFYLSKDEYVYFRNTVGDRMSLNWVLNFICISFATGKTQVHVLNKLMWHSIISILSLVLYLSVVTSLERDKSVLFWKYGETLEDDVFFKFTDAEKRAGSHS